MEWQPIETAPRDETRIIGLAKDGCVYKTHWQAYYDKWPHQEGGPTYRHGWSAETHDSHTPYSPTHWMPLPESPKP